MKPLKVEVQRCADLIATAVTRFTYLVGKAKTLDELEELRYSLKDFNHPFFKVEPILRDKVLKVNAARAYKANTLVVVEGASYVFGNEIPIGDTVCKVVSRTTEYDGEIKYRVLFAPPTGSLAYAWVPEKRVKRVAAPEEARGVELIFAVHAGVK